MFRLSWSIEDVMEWAGQFHLDDHYPCCFKTACITGMGLVNLKDHELKSIGTRHISPIPPTTGAQKQNQNLEKFLEMLQ